MPTPSPALVELLQRVMAGTDSMESLAAAIENTAIENTAIENTAIENDAVAAMPGATVDLGRESRCGFGEVIYGEGKPAELIGRIAAVQLAAGQDVLVTRVDAEAAAALLVTYPDAVHHSLARTIRIEAERAESPPQSAAHIAVVTAGSTDIPVAEEAAQTLAWMRVRVERFDDIGVAGPQRLLAAVPRLRTAAGVVVVAGMEGALPSVVAGHLSVPIFAVPTSVGYGASLGGLTPLLGMLSACAANVAVVNIDAGFKGGYLAGMIVRQWEAMNRDVETKLENETH